MGEVVAQTPSSVNKSIVAQTPSSMNKSIVAQTPSSVNKSIVAQTPSSVNKSILAQMPSSVNKSIVTQTPSSVNKRQVLSQVNKPLTEFTIKCRNLPHWQNPGSVYFITFRTYNEQILDDNSKQILYDNLLFYKNTLYQLFSFVIMPDHVHLILQPNEIDSNSYVNLSKIMQSIKGYASKMIIKYISQTRASELPIKHIFQNESFDRIIRHEGELLDKMNYILNNPVKKGLVDNGYTYKWTYINGNNFFI